MRDPESNRREADALDRLLSLVEGSRIDLDPEMLSALEALMKTIDSANEFERVSFEHEALANLRNTLRL